jgi:hypothetical protein
VRSHAQAALLLWLLYTTWNLTGHLGATVVVVPPPDSVTGTGTVVVGRVHIWTLRTMMQLVVGGVSVVVVVGATVVVVVGQGGSDNGVTDTVVVVVGAIVVVV